MLAVFNSLPPAVEQESSPSGSEEDDNNNSKSDKPVLDQVSPVQYFLEVCT